MELLHINVQVYMYMYWYKLKRNIQGYTSTSLLPISLRVCVYIKAHHYKIWFNAGKSISLLFVIYIVYTCTSNQHKIIKFAWDFNCSSVKKEQSNLFCLFEWWVMKGQRPPGPVSCWLVLPSEHAHDHYSKLGVGFFFTLLHCIRSQFFFHFYELYFCFVWSGNFFF